MNEAECFHSGGLKKQDLDIYMYICQTDTTMVTTKFVQLEEHSHPINDLCKTNVGKLKEMAKKLWNNITHYKLLHGAGT